MYWSSVSIRVDARPVVDERLPDILIRVSTSRNVGPVRSPTALDEMHGHARVGAIDWRNMGHSLGLA
jgi:hypothetical protein